MDEAKSGSAECEYEKTVQEKPDHCYNAGGDDCSGASHQIQNRPRPLRHVLSQSETGVFFFCPFQTEHGLSALDFPFFPAS